LKILRGDFNAEVGKKDIFKSIIGNEILHQISNDNGVRMINFTTAKITIFPHRDGIISAVKKVDFVSGSILYAQVSYEFSKFSIPNRGYFYFYSVPLVRERTILTERQPLIDEVNAKFVDRKRRMVRAADPYGRNLVFFTGGIPWITPFNKTKANIPNMDDGFHM
jgi:hypothetical protein